MRVVLRHGEHARVELEQASARIEQVRRRRVSLGGAAGDARRSAPSADHSGTSARAGGDGRTPPAWRDRAASRCGPRARTPRTGIQSTRRAALGLERRGGGAARATPRDSAARCVGGVRPSSTTSATLRAEPLGQPVPHGVLARARRDRAAGGPRRRASSATRPSSSAITATARPESRLRIRLSRPICRSSVRARAILVWQRRAGGRAPARARAPAPRAAAGRGASRRTLSSWNSRVSRPFRTVTRS